ncbi:DUF302 domain-containing protein [Mesorhizobium sp. WSM3626]|uniref:DUF302 domain-containing protein n=1 Tax=Mesorhizobium sp. WSM3626 TaxID=1040987 RepID=UPI0004B91612|nr:DUF302 domain-containing protein [Mesorhizobium sp. WSM3626]
MTEDGLITVQSRFGVTETIDRLAEVVKRAGLLVFARIDHRAGARDVGTALRPTELLIFGNPKGGTPLMQDQQLAGIDLPVKALAWEDEHGKVWLSYNDAHWIAERHDLRDASRNAVAAIAVEKVIAAAAGMDQS